MYKSKIMGMWEETYTMYDVINISYFLTTIEIIIYDSGFVSNFRTFGNQVLTFISNFLNNQKLTDAHTCYKLFKSEIFLKLNLQENDFAFCPEVTTKISLLNEEVKEVPIKYNGRTIKEGKKINFYDAIRALITIFKYRYFNKFKI